MKIKIKKIIAILLCAILLSSILMISLSAAEMNYTYPYCYALRMFLSVNTNGITPHRVCDGGLCYTVYYQSNFSCSRCSSIWMANYVTAIYPHDLDDNGICTYGCGYWDPPLIR